MTNSPNQLALKNTSSARLGIIAQYRRARVALSALDRMLMTEYGQIVLEFCRHHRTYVPVSPEIRVGQSFFDGSVGGCERIQVIAATARGFRVISGDATDQPRLDWRLVLRFDNIPGFRAFQLVKPLALAIAGGFTLHVAESQLRNAAKRIRQGATPRDFTERG